jgi:hypothetical protein
MLVFFLLFSLVFFENCRFLVVKKTVELLYRDVHFKFVFTRSICKHDSFITMSALFIGTCAQNLIFNKNIIDNITVVCENIKILF